MHILSYSANGVTNKLSIYNHPSLVVSARIVYVSSSHLRNSSWVSGSESVNEINAASEDCGWSTQGRPGWSGSGTNLPVT